MSSKVLGSGTADIRFKEGLTHDETLYNQPLPWRHEFTSQRDSSTVLITIYRADSDIVCRIEIDGNEVRNQPATMYGTLCAAPLTE